MRKLVLLVLLTAAINANAQYKFGIIAGVHNPTLTEGIAGSIGFQFGVASQFGVFYELPLNKTIHFRPRLMYSPQGDRVANIQKYQGASTLDYRLNYIIMPMDFKFWNKVYLIVGPQVSLLVSENATGVFLGPALSPIDVSVNLALGFKFNKVFLELGATQSVTPVLEFASYNKMRKVYNASPRISFGWYLL